MVFEILAYAIAGVMVGLLIMLSADLKKAYLKGFNRGYNDGVLDYSKGVVRRLPEDIDDLENGSKVGIESGVIVIRDYYGKMRKLPVEMQGDYTYRSGDYLIKYVGNERDKKSDVPDTNVVVCWDGYKGEYVPDLEDEKVVA